MEYWQHVLGQGVAVAVSLDTLRSYDKAWRDFLAVHRESVAVGVELHPHCPRCCGTLRTFSNGGGLPRPLKLQLAAISFSVRPLFDTDPAQNLSIRKALEGWGRLRTPQAAARWLISFELLTNLCSRLHSIVGHVSRPDFFQRPFLLHWRTADWRGGLETSEAGLTRGLFYQAVDLSVSEVTLAMWSSATGQLRRGTAVSLPAIGLVGPRPAWDMSKIFGS